MSDEQRSKDDQESPGLVDRVKGVFTRDDGGDERADSAVQSERGSSKGAPESRVDEVREALKAFGSGDHDTFLELLDEDVEWSAPSGDDFPGGGSHTGRDAVKEQFVDVVAERFSSFGFTPRTFLESTADGDDFVVVLGSYQGEGEGGELDAPAVQVWDFGGEDKVLKLDIYTDSAHFKGFTVIEEDEDDEDRSSEGEDGDGGGGAGGEAKDRSGGGGDGDEGEGDTDHTSERGEHSSEARASAESSSESEDADVGADEGQHADEDRGDDTDPDGDSKTT